MQWMLFVMICLCWCEVDATNKCTDESECQANMRNDWYDNKTHGSLKLTEADRTFLNQLGTPPKQQSFVAAAAAAAPGIRRECRTLSDAQRQLLFSAFQWLFTTKPNNSNTTRFQIFVSQHRSADAPEAHFGPCFPPWHREYLLRFERALQEYNETVNLCYWDSSLDIRLPDASQSCVWTPEYFGNGNGTVTTGFAAYIPAASDCTSTGVTLYRDVGGNQYLYNQTQLNTVLSSCYNYTVLMTPYTSNTFEAQHGGPHTFVYGHMGIITCSPLDPVFWFHHSFVDYRWEQCRQIQVTDKETDYPKDSAVPAAHRFNATMKPFLDKICIDGLSNSYIPGYYSYMPTPSNCTTHAQCGGKALWCNNGKCTACVRAGGMMGANWTNSACYITGCSTPKNVNKVCTCAP